MRRSGDFAVTSSQGAMVCSVSAEDTTPPPLSTGLRPDASFVAHLMAMAEQDAQPRVVQRTTSDVDAAYRAAANQNHATPPRGLRASRSA
jgi:hypothetical protein